MKCKLLAGLSPLPKGNTEPTPQINNPGGLVNHKEYPLKGYCQVSVKQNVHVCLTMNVNSMPATWSLIHHTFLDAISTRTPDGVLRFYIKRSVWNEYRRRIFGERNSFYE